MHVSRQLQALEQFELPARGRHGAGDRLAARLFRRLPRHRLDGLGGLDHGDDSISAGASTSAPQSDRRARLQLLILLLRGMSLKGADVGLRYILSPQWSLLWNSEARACAQLSAMTPAAFRFGRALLSKSSLSSVKSTFLASSGCSTSCRKGSRLAVG